MQRAVNEYQYFAKVFYEIKYALNFSPKDLEPRVREKFSPKLLQIFENPKLNLVLDRAKLEIADSLYFHASDLN